MRHFPSSPLPSNSLRATASNPNRRSTASSSKAPSRGVMARSHNFHQFPLAGGPKLAELAFRTIYHRNIRPNVAGDMVIRDEYKGWLVEARPIVMIDYHGVTFDHLVPSDDTDPEVLQINIGEIEDDGGVYANKYNPFHIDPAEYIGKKVLAVPRCCQKRKGTTDRERVNDAVNARDGR